MARIDQSINVYFEAAKQIELGQPKEKVLSILEPTQSALHSRERKQPDKYIRDGAQVEIHYFRSARQPDGFTTDDEFTPYMFNEGRLVAIGWAALGGPFSNARSPSGASTHFSQPRVPGEVTQEGDRKVYDADECIGPIINGRCHGTILPNKAYHPTCHGEWINGQCTGPMF
jgi:hypothetical protein